MYKTIISRLSIIRSLLMNVLILYAAYPPNDVFIKTLAMSISRFGMRASSFKKWHLKKNCPSPPVGDPTIYFVRMGSERKESKRSKKSRSEHKSHKKHKKHHRSKHNHDESSPSDNEIDYNDPSLWTAEKTIEGIAPIADTAPSAATAIAPTAVATAPVQLEATGGTVRDSWMTDASLDFSSFGTAKQKEPKEEKRNPDMV
jgi:hypothetical protein